MQNVAPMVRQYQRILNVSLTIGHSTCQSAYDISDRWDKLLPLCRLLCLSQPQTDGTSCSHSAISSACPSLRPMGQVAPPLPSPLSVPASDRWDNLLPLCRLLCLSQPQTDGTICSPSAVSSVCPSLRPMGQFAPPLPSPLPVPASDRWDKLLPLSHLLCLSQHQTDGTSCSPSAVSSVCPSPSSSSSFTIEMNLSTASDAMAVRAVHTTKMRRLP